MPDKDKQPLQQGAKATWRIGLKEQKQIQSVVIVIIILLMFVAFRPVILNTIQTRDFQTCQNNTRKIAQGIKTYTQDWDDTLPAASNWEDAASSNIVATSGTGFSVSSYFHCPSDKSGAPRSYSYNDWLAGLSLTVHPGDKRREDRLATIGRLDRAVLMIEIHGSAPNAHTKLRNWGNVHSLISLKHHIPEPTGSLILGDLSAASRNDEKLIELGEKRF